MVGSGEISSDASWEQMLARLRFLLTQVEEEVTNRNWRLPTQPWSQFFKRFSLPRTTLSDWSDRVALNSHIYQTNYLVVLSVFLVYYALTHPWSILLLCLIVAGWVFALSSVPISFQGKRVTPKQRLLLASVLSFVLLVFSGALLSFLEHFSLASAIVLSHATFRHTGMRTKIKEIREQMSNQW